jgi:UDP-N-acetyl-D-glucosamine dehydrogenase
MDGMTFSSRHAEELFGRIVNRQATVGIIGMGYVGLPLAVAAFQAGFSIIGFDVDAEKIRGINAGHSPISRIGDGVIGGMLQSGRFAITDQYSELKKCNIVIICVPTPLSKYREPDLSYVVKTTENIAANLSAGQFISLESTTYPGTTTQVMRPILEASGLKSGADFFLGYSPEREDPGNPDFDTASIPKVVGGDGADAMRLAEAFYGAVVAKIVPVSSCEVAEAVKLTENIFRSVNIALVNELKVIYDRMNINIWDVIDAAKTKPFGYMPFYPGPGLGGHCIPIDPFYLTWKAREYGVATRFIELAGEINTLAPLHVVEKITEALSSYKRKSVHDSEILMIGIAYKKNVEDTRESPAIRLIELLESRGAKVAFNDPFVPVIPHLREHPGLSGRKGVSLTPELIRSFDLVLICTDHDNVDYDALAEHATLIVDTRNAMARTSRGDLVVLA